MTKEHQLIKEQFAIPNHIRICETVFLESCNRIVSIQKVESKTIIVLASNLTLITGIGLRCLNIIDVLMHLSMMEKPDASIISPNSAYDEAIDEASIRSQFCILTYAACFTTSIHFRDRLDSMSITAQNFDNTLFSTQSNGTINNQTIYYPPESDQIFGACDCLRFRNTHKPCEHLALIGLSVLFSPTPESAAIEP